MKFFSRQQPTPSQPNEAGLPYPTSPVAAAKPPKRSDAGCEQCGSCESSCDDAALIVGPTGPLIDTERCTGCLECVSACPSGVLV